MKINPKRPKSDFLQRRPYISSVNTDGYFSSIIIKDFKNSSKLVVNANSNVLEHFWLDMFDSKWAMDAMWYDRGRIYRDIERA